MSPSYLTLSAFRTRTIMPPQDVTALAELRYRRQQGDATAADVTPEQPLGYAPANGAPVYAIFTPAAAVLADATNYATITISRRTAGGAPVVLAQGATTPSGLGSLSANVPIALPLIGSPTLLEGDLVTAGIAKAGAGVVIPAGIVALLPNPCFIDVRIADWTALIEARLRKRYAVPFTSPVPAAVLLWLTAAVTADCYERRGFNPGSEQDKDAILGARDRVLADLKEAADSVTGLFDLPLRDDTAGSGIVAEGPLSYTETSPYVAFDDQVENGRQEDMSRGR